MCLLYDYHVLRCRKHRFVTELTVGIFWAAHRLATLACQLTVKVLYRLRYPCSASPSAALLLALTFITIERRMLLVPMVP